MVHRAGTALFFGFFLAYGLGWAMLWTLQHGLGWTFAEAEIPSRLTLLLATGFFAVVVDGFLDPGRGPTAFGSATWMNRRGVRAMTEGGGLIVGREDRRDGRLLRYAGEAHLLTIAPTRSGKGVGAIIPNLLTTGRSVLCIDPKGENARIAAARRRQLGPVWVLDPFAVAGQPAAACNPLDAVDPASPDAIEEAATLAEALVVDPPHQVAEAHWNEEAKALLTGLVLDVAAEEPPERRTLATVRERLTLPPDDLVTLLERMQRSPAAHGLVARAANRHLGKADREAAGVLSSAQRHTHFLDSPRMTAVMARSDFRFAELEERTASVFLALPPDRLDAYRRWLRLMVAQALAAMARSPATPLPRCSSCSTSSPPWAASSRSSAPWA